MTSDEELLDPKRTPLSSSTAYVGAIKHNKPQEIPQVPLSKFF